MSFLLLPVRNLAGRPLRSALTAAGVALAVASFLALVGLSRGIERAWSDTLRERGTDVLAVTRGAVEILTGSLDEELAPEIAREPGVREVTGELIDLVTLDEGAPVLVAGWPSGSALWDDVELVSGSMPATGRPEEILVGRQLASALGLAPGDDFEILGEMHRVSGVCELGDVLSDSMILARLAPLQALLARPGRVTLFNLKLERGDDPAEVRAVLARLSDRFPNLMFTESGSVSRENHVLRLLRGVAWSISTVAFLMGGFFVLNTLLMSVTERTREMGVLVAVGWSEGRIAALILLEGLLLSVAGGLVGALVGVGGLEWLARLPQLRGFVDPQVTASVIAEVLAAAVLLGAAGGLYPAWRAQRILAVDALRYE